MRTVEPIEPSSCYGNPIVDLGEFETTALPPHFLNQVDKVNVRKLNENEENNSSDLSELFLTGTPR